MARIFELGMTLEYAMEWGYSRSSTGVSSERKR